MVLIAMTLVDLSVLVVAVATVALIAALVMRPSWTHKPWGKVLAFLALFMLPALVTSLGLANQLDRAKTTEFCLSCHEMKPYGDSLWVDAPWVAASHAQNNHVPRDRACYTCHTDYTMFGGAKAKLTGFKHVYVHYLGTIPESIALYRPYQNRECLRCHGGARGFEEDEMHAEIRTELMANEISCLECHEPVHAVDELADQSRWQGAPP